MRYTIRDPSRLMLRVLAPVEVAPHGALSFPTPHAKLTKEEGQP